MAEKFDIAVIGSGPGGYTAALKCVQRGATVAIIEKDAIGGVCLNCGCIPSKALLGCAHVLNLAKKAASFGVDLDNPRVNWPKMQANRETIVTQLRKGLTGLIQGSKIKIFNGTGIVTAPNKIEVQGNTPAEIEAGKIIISTGSVSTELPFIPYDGKTIISSTEALTLSEIPKSMIVIGGGFIGCELGTVYASVGTKVTIIEALENILPLEDDWIGKLLTRELKKMGMEILTGKKVTGSEKTESGAKILLEDGSSYEAEKILVSVGRRAFCDQQTVDNLSLGMNKRLVKVNAKMETNVPGVYAIGDVVGTTYLAHGAYYEGEVAAINATGGNAEVKDYHLVPRAIYTFPEIAGVGLTESKCKQQGIEYTVNKSFFRANGRSLSHQETVGEIRVIREKSSNKVLGVTMLGDNVTELVATARALMGSTEKIDDIVFAHPTVSEVLKEAWLGSAH